MMTFNFITMLLSLLQCPVFVHGMALIFVGCCFRLVWGLCVPSRFSGGRTGGL